MIELKNVSVVKSGVRLLENLNWKINRGEHWLISGSNGSGKTILLELLAGNIHAVEGEVCYDFVQGKSWDQRYAERKAFIQYIPAHAIQTFSPGHELFYQQRYYSIGDERTPLVNDILGDEVSRIQTLEFPQSFNMEALLLLPVTRLSNGQLKKVLILKTLLRDWPKVLLFDYPFEGLDHQSRRDLADFMDHLARAFDIQLIIADHDHHLPAAINRKLVVDKCAIRSTHTITSDGVAVASNRQQVNVRSDISDTVPIVEMRNLTIRYGESEIIKKLNWTIRKGERWALTGKNGSGKTTLFSFIFADHPMAYSEQVYLFGKRRGSGESIWDIKKRINYMGPELIHFLNLESYSTPMDYIRQQQKGIAQQKVDEIVLFFQAEQFIHNAMKVLSSGQLQLTLLMSCLLSDKELLLLDEPFQFLDMDTRQRVNEYLQAHLHEETTLVLITHYEQDIEHWTRQRLHLG